NENFHTIRITNVTPDKFIHVAQTRTSCFLSASRNVQEKDSNRIELWPRSGQGSFEREMENPSSLFHFRGCKATRRVTAKDTPGHSPGSKCPIKSAAKALAGFPEDIRRVATPS